MKKILIIGATSGIATAVARLFAQDGHALYLLGRNQEKLSTLATDLSVRGASEVSTGHFDAADVNGHEKTLDKALSEFGQFDQVLLAHGDLPDQKECEHSFEKSHTTLTTNLLSPIAFLTWLAPYFEKRKTGTIAVITSVAGDRGRQSNYIYGTAKGALSRYLQGLRNRLAPQGVAVTDIKPGFISTSMTEHLKQGMLFVPADVIAKGIQTAMDKGKHEVYLPRFWWLIMAIIKHIPECVFKRLKL